MCCLRNSTTRYEIGQWDQDDESKSKNLGASSNTVILKNIFGNLSYDDIALCFYANLLKTWDGL